MGPCYLGLLFSLLVRGATLCWSSLLGRVGGGYTGSFGAALVGGGSLSLCLSWLPFDGGCRVLGYTDSSLSLVGRGTTLVDGDSAVLWGSWLLDGGSDLLLPRRGNLRWKDLLGNLLSGGPGDASRHAASHWRYWGVKAPEATSHGGERQLAWFKGWGWEQVESWEIGCDKVGACWRRSAAESDVRTPD